MTREEVLAKYDLDKNLPGMDLRGLDLSYTNLTDADLRDADLMDADLRGADLTGANLRDADLRDADLRGADLRGADLRGANLDFSCLPLWCGSFNMIVNKDFVAQLLCHVLRLKCDDDEVKAIQSSLDVIRLANQFHLVGNGVPLIKVGDIDA